MWEGILVVGPTIYRPVNECKRQELPHSVRFDLAFSIFNSNPRKNIIVEVTSVFESEN